MLDSLGLIRVSGTDRAPFLQGQITQDVALVNAARSALFGWTTARGRLLVTGQLIDWRDSLWLTAPATLAEDLVRRLRMFVLRAKVTVDVADLMLIGLAGAAAAAELRLNGMRLPADPLSCVGTDAWCATRLGGDPGRVLVVAERGSGAGLIASLRGESMGEPEWRLADIRAGLPSVAPATADAFIPQMVNLDLVGGVSFSKGCYVGQEIITRTRHLGRVKRRMLRFRCAGAVHPGPGDPIFGSARESGQVVSAAATAEGLELLAVTQLEDGGQPLYADAEHRHALQPLDLPYLIPAPVRPS